MHEAFWPHTKEQDVHLNSVGPVPVRIGLANEGNVRFVGVAHVEAQTACPSQCSVSSIMSFPHFIAGSQ